MKNLKSIIVAFVAISAVTVSAQSKKINTSTSTLEWVGKKITGQHNGTVKFKEGSLIFKSKKIVGGKFIVDMTTLSTTDLDGEYKDKLDGHLKADDFFGTSKFPTASLTFKKIATKSPNLYTVTADLTIKGITKPISFDLAVSGNSATTAFKVDRTKYDIKYGSKSFFESLGDKAIEDDFELKISLKY